MKADDVRNIIKEFKLPDFYYDKKDFESVRLFVFEDQKKGADSVVFHYEGDDNDVIALGIQTKSQRDFANLYGKYIYLADGTHDVLYRYDHRLVTLMTIDQFGRGMYIGYKLLLLTFICIVSIYIHVTFPNFRA